MGWFQNIFHPEQAQLQQRQQLFSSFDHSVMGKLSPEQQAANRAQLHDLFAANTWNSLDLDTKKQAVQALENDFAFQQGRPAKTVEVTPLKDGLYGGWNAERDTIRLNKNLLQSGTLYNSPDAQPMPDANMQIFDTVAHEGYHAYQSYAMKHPEVHEDKAQLREWALNEGKYYDTGDRYFIQPQERDAWQYGYNATTEAFRGIEARNGPEPAETKAEYENTALSSSYHAALAREQRRDPQVLQTMEQEMEAGCQAKGIPYEFGPKNQILQNGPLPQNQGVQQGQAPPEPGDRMREEQAEGENQDFSMDEMAQAPAEEATQVEGQEQNSTEEQTNVENQEQSNVESQEQAERENQDFSMDEMAQAPAEEATQVEGQEQNSTEEQSNVENQEQVESENQDFSMDEMAEIPAEEASQAEGQEQNSTEEQTNVETQEQAESENQDFSMDEMAQAPAEEATQVEGQGQESTEEQANVENQEQAESENQDFSMDEMAQAPAEETAQEEGFSMDQMADQAPAAEESQWEENAPAQEPDHTEEQGSSEDESQGYSY